MNVFKKALLAEKVFIQGAKEIALNSSAVTAGAAIGISQGLKYNGDFKRGVKSGVVTYGSLCVVGGLYNLAMNAKQIKKAEGFDMKDGNIMTYEIKD